MNAYMAYRVTTKVSSSTGICRYLYIITKWMHQQVITKITVVVFFKTSISMFHRSEFSVKRRFSDFLGLHSKLATKYMHIGYIVPPAPEKSIVGKSVSCAVEGMCACHLITAVEMKHISTCCASKVVTVLHRYFFFLIRCSKLPYIPPGLNF